MSQSLKNIQNNTAIKTVKEIHTKTVTKNIEGQKIQQSQNNLTVARFKRSKQINQGERGVNNKPQIPKPIPSQNLI